jgi:hypothetical protein
MKLIKNPKIKSIKALIAQGKSIIDKMVAATGYFSGASALLATAQTSLNLLRNAASVAEQGSKADTSAMYLAEIDFRAKLMILVLYVDVVAITNPTESLDIITAAGLFEKRQGVINVADIAVKLAGVSGKVVLKAKAKKGRSYLFQKSTGSAVWEQIIISTTSKVLVEDLTPIKTYWFRVALIKGTTQGDFTDPVSIVVL